MKQPKDTKWEDAMSQVAKKKSSRPTDYVITPKKKKK